MVLTPVKMFIITSGKYNLLFYSVMTLIYDKVSTDSFVVTQHAENLKL